METIERAVHLPTDLASAWELITEPSDLEAWLGHTVGVEPTPGATGHVVEHDGTVRELVIGDVQPGRRLSWTWRDGEHRTSHVEITLAPSDVGTTVRVVEHLLPVGSGTDARARASAAGEAWSHRLLHLEALLLVAAAVRG